MARRYGARSVEIPVQPEAVSWTELSKSEAFALVKRGEITQDQFEDFFQITETEMEELNNAWKQ